MKRREFITLLGGAAIAWPLSVRAQQSATPIVVFLHGGSSAGFAPFMSGFHTGLKEAGFAEGNNVAIVYRCADNQYDRLPAMASELVDRQVAVIFAGGSVLAAKRATASIPIVFTTGEDPVKAGLVASLNRPGGNVTGVTLFYVELGAKRVELLREIVPKVSVIGFLANSKSPQGIGNSTEAEQQETDVRTVAAGMQQEIITVHASNESDIEKAFAALVQQQVGALIIASDIFLSTRRDQLVALSARYGIPTIYPWRDAVIAGGLMSYGIVLSESYRHAGNYVGRILKGAKPAELPVVQPTKFALAVNLKTAKALGINVPQTLMVGADEVIE